MITVMFVVDDGAPEAPHEATLLAIQRVRRGEGTAVYHSKQFHAGVSDCPVYTVPIPEL